MHKLTIQQQDEACFTQTQDNVDNGDIYMASEMRSLGDSHHVAAAQGPSSVPCSPKKMVNNGPPCIDSI